MREGERDCKVVCSTLFLEGGTLSQTKIWFVLASLLGELLSLPLETGLTDGSPDPANIYVDSGALNSSL